MNLLEIENQFSTSCNIDKIKDDLTQSFFRLIHNEENIEIKNEIDEYAKGNDLVLIFSGISLHILNHNKRAPYFFARLDISTNSLNNPFAWYDIEYGVQGEFLDDYLDFY
ncbi:hypothetical protein [Edaphocola flava]|uniref:hypothetical protein n=1 Tax=Edaphocola flava TaxID=2499629 RepID=UPI00100AD172|nr:hypothetical protein [Edaphocola flava]